MEINGTGILGWDGRERRTNRYGTFVLMQSGYEGNGRAKVEWSDSPGLLLGRRVSIKALVMEARMSGHIGDLFRNIFPTQPEVGETIDLGEGTFFMENFGWHDGNGIGVGIVPDDGRDFDWMDPAKLYRLHDQTVLVTIKEVRMMNNTHSYTLNGKTRHIDVRLGRKIIGHIKKAKDGSGYFYQPEGSKLVGETFATIAEVKRSLEEE